MNRPFASPRPLRWGFALALGLASMGAAAQVIIERAPPPPRHEVAPPGRPGFVWIPGHYTPRGHGRSFVWVGGTWVRERPGYRYRPGDWHREGRGWAWHDGAWMR